MKWTQDNIMKSTLASTMRSIQVRKIHFLPPFESSNHFFLGQYHEVNPGQYHEVNPGQYHEVNPGQYKLNEEDIKVSVDENRWVESSETIL